MPQLPKQVLLDKVRLAAERAGWRIVFDTPETPHPFQVRLFKEEQSYPLIVYIWTLTPGGGGPSVRPGDEWRIQVTGVTPPLIMAPGRSTLLLGWHEETEVFAGFDPLRHRWWTGRSPSIQIKESTLLEARQQGLAVYPKGNGELAVAFRPDALPDYVRLQESLHQFGDTPERLEVLQTVLRGEEVPQEELTAIPTERQIVARTVALRQRESTFRRRVLNAYSYQCAVCEIQLNLVEAAHIVPVYVQGSTDLTSNGLALCSLHHKGYDSALIAVDEHYSVRVSQSQVQRLQVQDLGGGLDVFRNPLRQDILVPPQLSERPRPDFLAEGMRIRGWEP